MCLSHSFTRTSLRIFLTRIAKVKWILQIIFNSLFLHKKRKWKQAFLILLLSVCSWVCHIFTFLLILYYFLFCNLNVKSWILKWYQNRITWETSWPIFLWKFRPNLKWSSGDLLNSTKTQEKIIYCKYLD